MNVTKTMNSPAKKHYQLPVFLTLEGQPCVIIGGGTVALRKASDLLNAGAAVTVIAENPSPDIERLHRQGDITVLRKHYEPKDVNGAFLDFAATDNGAVNVEVFDAAKQRGILVNVVDCPELCNFFSGAVVRRGPLQIAISTSGSSPALAAAIRRELEERYTESYGEFVSFAGEIRKKIMGCDTFSGDAKQEALLWLAKKEEFELFLESGKDTVWERLQKIIFSS